MSSTSDTSDVYVIVVAMPGYLPEQEPYAIRTMEAAYECARHEFSDDDSMPYSRAEFNSALTAGGAAIPLASGYTVEIVPLDSLDPSPEEVADYLADID